MISTSLYQTRFGELTKNNTAANLALGLRYINDSIRILTNKYYFNEASFTTLTVSGQQFYNLPPQCRKIINVTGTVGDVVWITKDAPDRTYWDILNTIPFDQDFPMFHFIWNHNTQVGIWPTPSSAGNIITVNYQERNVDLSQPDYVTGTATLVNGSAVINFSGTALIQNMVGRWIQIPAPNGDNQWYQIQVVNSATQLTLYGPYTGPSVSTTSFTIGEMPTLAEDYQDLPLYRALEIYYTSIVPNDVMSKLYRDLYDTGYEQLNSDYGQKTTSVVLTDTSAPLINPNLFQNNVYQV